MSKTNIFSNFGILQFINNSKIRFISKIPVGELGFIAPKFCRKMQLQNKLNIFCFAKIFQFFAIFCKSFRLLETLKISLDNSSKISMITLKIIFYRAVTHCGLKVSRSQAKIDENFANYFLKTKAINKCFIVLNCT